MFIKTKERAGRTVYFLCIPEQGGSGGRSWKAVEYSVSLGETLGLTSAEWVEILRASPIFRSVALDDVLGVLEQYVAAHGLSADILAGLREAAHHAKQKKASRRGLGERRSEEEERVKALRLLGLPPGSSDDQIESAFRRAARRHHPDVGGDATKFRAILEARNLLLGRSSGMGEPA